VGDDGFIEKVEKITDQELKMREPGSRPKASN
jgi:hypothetical protein